MMFYDEQAQKTILRMMESDILALIVIDTLTDEYEVIYSDVAYRDYSRDKRKRGFFERWRTDGRRLIDPRDRERMMEEIDRDRLLMHLEENDTYSTTCRFALNGRSSYSRIKVRKDLLEPDTLIISIRDVDQEIREEQERALRDLERQRDMEELEHTLREMRTKNFVSQMHPHFLYNALSSIREIVLNDPEYGADLLYDFTVHLRAGIRAMTRDEKIPFSQELENIRAYANIEKMRLGDKLTMQYDIQTEDFEVVPLSIEPIVENAIRHGIYESARSDGLVVVRTEAADNGVIVTIEDNGTGFDAEAVRNDVKTGRSDSTGLYNLLFRLEKMMGAAVDIQSRPGEGTRVEVRIPVAK